MRGQSTSGCPIGPHSPSELESTLHRTHRVTRVLLGIPLGLANFKLIPSDLPSCGRDILSLEEAERHGLWRRVTMQPHSCVSREATLGTRTRMRMVRRADASGRAQLGP